MLFSKNLVIRTISQRVAYKLRTLCQVHLLAYSTQNKLTLHYTPQHNFKDSLHHSRHPCTCTEKPFEASPLDSRLTAQTAPQDCILKFPLISY